VVFDHGHLWLKQIETLKFFKHTYTDHAFVPGIRV